MKLIFIQRAFNHIVNTYYMWDCYQGIYANLGHLENLFCQMHDFNICFVIFLENFDTVTFLSFVEWENCTK